jgi:hypothetical protein
VPAKSTIVIQLIGVGFINGDVVHVLAFGAKFHFLIYYILLLYVIIHKIKSIFGGTKVPPYPLLFILRETYGYSAKLCFAYAL